MSVYLTDTGFQQKTLVDLRTELEAAYTSVFGSTVDLSPEGPLGQIIAINAKMLADLWEGAQEIYTSRDPDQATGEALDNICAETGISRLPATAATAPDVLNWLPFNTATTIPAGSKIKAANSPATYGLIEGIAGVLHATASPYNVYNGVRLKYITGTAGDTRRLGVNGYNCVFVIQSGDTDAEVVRILADTLNANNLGVTATPQTLNGVLYIQIIGDHTLTPIIGFTDDATSQQAVKGDFLCDTVGLRSVPAMALDTIATPVTNWLSIEQPVAGMDGTGTETDTALRLRRLTGMRSGTGTDEAIRQAIYRVSGVTKAVVTSNRGDIQDLQGRPAHSFEAVVFGGTDQAVATAIWNTMPSGIQDFGNVTPVPKVTGKDGLLHPVHFSRPVPVYAWAKVVVSEYNYEETTPDDMVAAIQEAVSTWGNANFGLGDDYVLQKLYAPVYTVKGLYTLTIQIAVTAAASGTPTYVGANIGVSSREYLSFAASRVEVVLP